jgi:hypothetical protein
MLLPSAILALTINSNPINSPTITLHAAATVLLPSAILALTIISQTF